MSTIIDKLEVINARFHELGVALTNPEVVNDNKRFSQVSKEYRKLEKIADIYKVYRNCLSSVEFAKEIREKRKKIRQKTIREFICGGVI